MGREVKNLPATKKKESLTGEVIDKANDSDIGAKAFEDGITAINAMVVTAKTEAAIAKKEADNRVNTTKTYVEMEKAYFDSLTKELERKNLAPEERAEIREELKASITRMKSTEEEDRRMTENSPFRKKANYLACIVVVAVIIGAGAKYYYKR